MQPDKRCAIPIQNDRNGHDNSSFIVHYDKRGTIPVENDRLSDETIEEVQQTRYPNKSPSDYKESRGLRSFSKIWRALNENQNFNGYNRTAKEKQWNRREAIKLILDYYQIIKSIFRLNK